MRITDNKVCCGCTACYHSCPKHAITFHLDRQGFPRPYVSKDNCIDCGICEKVCPLSETVKIPYSEWEKPLVYGAIHASNEIRHNSQSGGAFTALSESVLMDGGIVYGCMLNSELTAVHSRATTQSERDLFRGSKYVQSSLENIFPQVKADLERGNKILFSGTPCQIAGLKNYLGSKNQDNIIYLDLICHGVPSPKLWADYLSFMEEKYKGKITSANFRNKNREKGWRDHVETLVIENKEYDSKFYASLFYASFLNEACFNCPFRSVRRVGDITIADYWAIQDANPDFDDNKGTSQIFVNSKKGYELFQKSTHNLNYFESSVEKSRNGGLEANFVKKFWYTSIIFQVYLVFGMRGLYLFYQLDKILDPLKYGKSICISAIHKIYRIFIK